MCDEITQKSVYWPSSAAYFLDFRFKKRYFGARHRPTVSSCAGLTGPAAASPRGDGRRALHVGVCLLAVVPLPVGGGSSMPANGLHTDTVVLVAVKERI